MQVPDRGGRYDTQSVRWVLGLAGAPPTAAYRHHATTPPRHHATAPPRHHATAPPRHRATTPPPHHHTTTPPTLRYAISMSVSMLLVSHCAWLIWAHGWPGASPWTREVSRSDRWTLEHSQPTRHAARRTFRNVHGRPQYACRTADRGHLLCQAQFQYITPPPLSPSSHLTGRRPRDVDIPFRDVRREVLLLRDVVASTSLVPNNSWSYHRDCRSCKQQLLYVAAFVGR